MNLRTEKECSNLEKYTSDSSFDNTQKLEALFKSNNSMIYNKSKKNRMKNITYISGNLAISLANSPPDFGILELSNIATVDCGNPVAVDVSEVVNIGLINKEFGVESNVEPSNGTPIEFVLVVNIGILFEDGVVNWGKATPKSFGDEFRKLEGENGDIVVEKDPPFGDEVVNWGKATPNSFGRENGDIVVEKDTPFGDGVVNWGRATPKSFGDVGRNCEFKNGDLVVEKDIPFGEEVVNWGSATPNSFGDAVRKFEEENGDLVVDKVIPSGDVVVNWGSGTPKSSDDVVKNCEGEKGGWVVNKEIAVDGGRNVEVNWERGTPKGSSVTESMKSSEKVVPKCPTSLPLCLTPIPSTLGEGVVGKNGVVDKIGLSVKVTSVTVEEVGLNAPGPEGPGG